MSSDFSAFSDPGLRSALLALSRAELALALRLPAPEASEAADQPAPSLMAQVWGLFVTLKIRGSLRGCIGHIIGRWPLSESLPELTRAAAFEDPRFPPLRPNEFPSIRIELSLLSPPWAIDSWQRIIIGQHGMLLSLKGRQAVFLPQVAVEQGWNLETTLTALAHKAGMEADAWRNPACRFEVFEAIHFGEEQ